MFFEAVWALMSLAALIFASWCVSEGGEILGEKYDATIVGGFVIAWLNTAPETVFFITALEQNNPNFAVGALSGSVIVVATVALGACIYYGSSARDSGRIFLQHGVRKQSAILLLTLMGPLICVITGFSGMLGMIFIAEYLAFVVFSLQDKKTDNKDIIKVEDLEAAEDSDDEEEAPTWKGVAYLVAGGGLIMLFSDKFIQAIAAIGTELHFGSLVLAFFLGPIASEAPEILESVSLSRKGKTQNINIAFSNLMGGTISKTTLLLGILNMYAVTRGFEWNYHYTISLMLVTTAAGAAAVIGSFFQEVPKWHGFLLIGVFLFTAIVQYSTAASGGEVVTVDGVVVGGGSGSG
eukprot:GFYU01019925.1.p1 GENE.GFYU01019925.1~~GFYU01019925.1.p1  ORF type:complete len:351 (+),score=85.65 GFYU01019925.1:53-1105(+)